MEVTPIVEKLFKKSPGLDLVVAIVSGLTVPFLVDKEFMEKWAPVAVPVIWAVAMGLAQVSGKLDDYVFDPLYGAVKTKAKWYARLARRGLFPVTFYIDRKTLSKKLDGKRRSAVLNLKTPPQNSKYEPQHCAGIYKTATKIFEGREEWEHEIKARLEFSKAARVFIIPLLIQFGWECLRFVTFGRLPYLIPIRAEHAPMRMLANMFRHAPMSVVVTMFQNPIVRYLLPPIAIFVVLQITAFVYLYLRIVHMSNLFDLVSKSKVFRFVANCERNGVREPREMLNVGSVIVPQCELSIFQTKILYAGIEADLQEELEKINQCIHVKRAKDFAEMEKAIRKGEADVFLIKSGSEEYPRETLAAAADPNLPSEDINRYTLTFAIAKSASDNTIVRTPPKLFVLQAPAAEQEKVRP